MKRAYLNFIQDELNDAHANVTDAVAMRGDFWRDDETRLLDCIDRAIMQVATMRADDFRADLPIRVRPLR